MLRQPVLVGDPVTLAPTTPADHDARFAVAADPAIRDRHSAHDRWRPGVLRAFFDEGLAGGGMLTIRDALSGEVIGSSRYGAHDSVADEIEVGWTCFARKPWRRGHDREAKRVMLDHILVQGPVVVFHVGADNRRSRAAVEAPGADLRPGRVEVRRAGRPVPHVVYELRRR